MVCASRSPPPVSPAIRWSSGRSRTVPRSVMPAASAHDRSASSAGPLSWLPPMATTAAPVERSADSARVTIRVASCVLVELVQQVEEQGARGAGLLLACELGLERHADHEGLRSVGQVVQVV